MKHINKAAHKAAHKAQKKAPSAQQAKSIPEHVFTQIWDIVVIGGGPAGMMAAGQAAEALRAAEPQSPKPSILLIEKNDSLGKKLLITGGGRCNLTNAEFDDRTLLAKFKHDGKYLFSAFSQYSVKESLEFFNSRGMETKTEANKRVFPLSNKAQSVWDVLVTYISKGVTVISHTPVKDFVIKENITIEEPEISVESSDKNAEDIKKPKQKVTREMEAVTLKNGKIISGKQFILATGGKSHPETGSTGDGFEWLRKIGHTIIEPSTALVPVKVKDEWVKKMAGVTLEKVKVTIFQNNVKQLVHGSLHANNLAGSKLLFTHFGISGPTVLNMSRDIGELLQYGEVEISLDLLPEHDYATLNAALQELFKKNHTKKIKNALSELILSALVPIAIDATNKILPPTSKIDPDTACNSITREQRVALVKALKDIRTEADGLLGAHKSIITSGGVKLDEIDFKTMQSRHIRNLYVVGDMLDIERPSGGYSLQLCWTTGFVAGTTAAQAIAKIEARA